MVSSLMGTSLCRDADCSTCICRLQCSFILLKKNLEVVAEVLHVSVDELFPTLKIHRLIIEGK